VTLSDFFYSSLLYIPLSLPLIYVLTILLRVVCHFNGVEIPTLGRAFFATAAAGFLSAIAAVLLHKLIAVSPSRELTLVGVILLCVLALVTNSLITTSLYLMLLGVRLGKALRLWLYQAGLFALLALVGGCCVGAMFAVWERVA